MYYSHFKYRVCVNLKVKFRCQKVKDGAKSERVTEKYFIKSFCYNVHVLTRNGTTVLKHIGILCSWIITCSTVKCIKKNPTRCNNVSKFYFSIFIWSPTCFGRHTAHHQEPKSILAASGISYVKGCWTCSWWTLSGTVCAWKMMSCI
jgi:hypothetical protein